MKGNQIFFIGFLAIVLQMVRIAARYFIDGSFLYQHVVVFIAHTGLAASLMLIIRYFVKKNQFYRFLKKHIGQVIYMDRLSVYVYIVHYSFLKGILATDKITGNAFVWIPTFLLMTFVTAMALKTLSSLKNVIILAEKENRKQNESVNFEFRNGEQNGGACLGAPKVYDGNQSYRDNLIAAITYACRVRD